MSSNMSMSQDVREFQQKFQQVLGMRPQHLTQRKLRERFQCMAEELQEFQQACETQDLAGQADALIDLVYFAIGTANMLGLPWEVLWADVHRANMAKERGSKMRQGSMHIIDVIKPPGWAGPRTEAILMAYGYDKEIHSQEQYHADDPIFKRTPDHLRGT